MFKILSDYKRFWAVVLAVGIVFLRETFGITEDDATKIVTLIIAFIAGDSWRKHE